MHRFEAGEHADAVDNAAALLQDAEKQGSTGAVKVDPKVAQQMTQKIKLANGLEVTPGEITAMMGDFYGAYDKDGRFNPSKSFDALYTADVEEMKGILKAVNHERESVGTVKSGQESTFHETDPGELENLTKWRKPVTDADGTTTGFSMLELAKQNDSHFSKQDASGTDNNRGAYAAFHKMALEAAANGDKNKALALEASAQHFLTDRFAGGHPFDKDGLMNGLAAVWWTSPLRENRRRRGPHEPEGSSVQSSRRRPLAWSAALARHPQRRESSWQRRSSGRERRHGRKSESRIAAKSSAP